MTGKTCGCQNRVGCVSLDGPKILSCGDTGKRNYRRTDDQALDGAADHVGKFGDSTERVKDVVAAGGEWVIGPNLTEAMGVDVKVKGCEGNTIGLWQPLR